MLLLFATNKNNIGYIIATTGFGNGLEQPDLNRVSMAIKKTEIAYSAELKINYDIPLIQY
ncbi:MAG: hypothetical protein V7723_13190 [Sneathiella sp.]|uniref:hypothetical protein n=1 Tax=Sneathiella sp. TaxID=1964365 RepID=UPI0030036661